MMGLPIVCTAAVTGLGMTRDDGRENTVLTDRTMPGTGSANGSLEGRPKIPPRVLSTDDNCFPQRCIQGEDFGYNMLKTFLNVLSSVCEKTAQLLITACQPSPLCCSYLCDNNRTIVTAGACMRAEEASSDCQK